MRKTRFMSLLFLVWSIAFFLVPEFRQGLQVPMFGWGWESGIRWLIRAGTLPAERLAEAVRGAEQQRDTRTLAFVALHSPDVQEGLRLADKAAALDPSLTWVYLSLYSQAVKAGSYQPELDRLVARMEAWDPDNAVSFLLAAHQISSQRGSNFPAPHRLELLAQETAWREAMQKAFAAPRYESYSRARFELERTWLRQHHLDKPAVILLSMASYPVPNFLQIRMYASLLVKELAKKAEETGHVPEALGHYWTVAHMGERMQTQGLSLIEKLMGAALQTEAYDRLIPLLRKTGRADEAAALDAAQQQLHQRLDTLQGRDPLAQSSTYNWAALTVGLFAGLVMVFGALTVVCFVYVNAKRWVRPERRGRLYQFMTVAENYMPVLLFFVCLGLYLSYYPYAQNFHHYMTASGEIHDFEPLFYNVLPTYGTLAGQAALPVENPFRPFAWYALIGLVLAVLAAIPYPRRIR